MMLLMMRSLLSVSLPTSFGIRWSCSFSKKDGVFENLIKYFATYGPIGEVLRRSGEYISDNTNVRGPVPLRYVGDYWRLSVK